MVAKRGIPVAEMLLPSRSTHALEYIVQCSSRNSVNDTCNLPHAPSHHMFCNYKLHLVGGWVAADRALWHIVAAGHVCNSLLIGCVHAFGMAYS